MQQPLKITFRGMPSSAALERRIRAKAGALERFHDRITSCHVTVESPHQHHHKGNLHTVRVAVCLPDKEIVAGREHRHDPAHENVNAALRDAFDAAVRQLEDYARQRRGEVKRHEALAREQATRLGSDSSATVSDTPSASDTSLKRRKKKTEPRLIEEIWPGNSTLSWDAVDEAGWESFPASDAPAWNSPPHRSPPSFEEDRALATIDRARRGS